MNETNIDWDDLRLFLAVAKQGGLAGAVEPTGKSAPTLGRRMLGLEQHLGKELFERQARGYRLTAHGQELLDKVLSLENDILPMLSPVKGSSVRRVKISAGTWVTQLLSQHVASLLANDTIILQFISADHALDFSHREAVIGVRNHRPTEIALAGRQAGKVEFAVYASSETVETWVCVVGSTPSANWVREQVGNAVCIEVTNPRNALDIALSGVAKVVLPIFIGDRAEGLIRVGGTVDSLAHTQWLVTHHEERHVPEVRRVIERIHRLLLSTNL